MEPDNGGYAFPQEWSTFTDADYGGGQIHTYHHTNGMSLRTWFAGKALSGPGIQYADLYNPESVAKMAYRIADAMLMEAKKIQ